MISNTMKFQYTVLAFHVIVDPPLGDRKQGRQGKWRIGQVRRMPADRANASAPAYRKHCQRGNSLAPINTSSTARAAWRPSRMAQTTRLWPRRMSPAAKTLSIFVR